MKHVTIEIGDADIQDLKEIFKNESDFKPMTRQDKLIIQILRQVLDNPKTEICDSVDL
jgi:hypothetical protein